MVNIINSSELEFIRVKHSRILGRRLVLCGSRQFTTRFLVPLSGSLRSSPLRVTLRAVTHLQRVHNSIG
ncbi:hypothetical protein E2C01_008827 [Portunus trituberculatus]|uniref:Uncharacterized protein n=1 Tax=Portunus trituberculatus TaxID=210409 RepID=A0A5B7D2Z5_PORTR|nr:hypothetical protein [Portunus trituberculatus]